MVKKVSLFPTVHDPRKNDTFRFLLVFGIQKKIKKKKWHEPDSTWHSRYL